MGKLRTVSIDANHQVDVQITGDLDPSYKNTVESEGTKIMLGVFSTSRSNF